jgi:hypothetical protein
MKANLILRVEVLKVEVEDGYYTIYYQWRKDGGKWKKEEINDDFENGDSDKEWKKRLENGIALEYALKDVAENY